MLSFKTITLADAEYIQKFVQDFEPYSDFNFVSLYSWSLHSQAKYCIKDRGLFLSMPDYVTQKPIFSFIGQENLEGNFEEIIKWLRKSSLPLHLELLPDFMLEPLTTYLKSKGEQYSVHMDRDSYDYIVDTHKLTYLKGKSYEDIRYKLNKFKKTYGDKIRDIDFDSSDVTHINRAAKLANKWANHKKDKNAAYEDEMYAFDRFIGAAKKVRHLKFKTYEIDDEIVGMVACEVLSSRYAIGHFLKYDPSVSGIYYYLVNNICSDLASDAIPFLNIEQDLGITGLRTAKMHLKPVSLLKKFSLEVHS